MFAIDGLRFRLQCLGSGEKDPLRSEAASTVPCGSQNLVSKKVSCLADVNESSRVFLDSDRNTGQKRTVAVELTRRDSSSS